MRLLLILLCLARAAPSAPSGPGESPTEQARWLSARWQRAIDLDRRVAPSQRDPDPAELRIIQARSWLDLEMELAQTRWRGDAVIVSMLSHAAANARISAREHAAALLAGRDVFPREKRGLRQMDLLEWRLATRLDAWTWRTPAPTAAPVILDIELSDIESDMNLPRRCWPRGAVHGLAPLLGEAHTALDGGDPVVMGALTVVLVEAHRQVNRTRCTTARGPAEAPTVPEPDRPPLPAALEDWAAKLSAHLDAAAAAPARGGEVLEAATRELLIWELPADLPPELAEAATRRRWEAVMDGAERSWRAWSAGKTTSSTPIIEAGRSRCAALMAYALDEIRGSPIRFYP